LFVERQIEITTLFFWVVTPCKLHVALKMVTVCITETMVSAYESAHNTREQHCHLHRRVNLKIKRSFSFPYLNYGKAEPCYQWSWWPWFFHLDRQYRKTCILRITIKFHSVATKAWRIPIYVMGGDRTHYAADCQEVMSGEGITNGWEGHSSWEYTHFPNTFFSVLHIHWTHSFKINSMKWRHIVNIVPVLCIWFRRNLVLMGWELKL
jgi:hypothetical protein